MAKKNPKTQTPENNLSVDSPIKNKRLIIVGIGASAGGLSALQAFFEALPANTGMAYVVVTHLHPDRESHMAELLQMRTHMPVSQVVDMVAVEPNHVYVIPPNQQIVITDTHLSADKFDEPRGFRTPIDQFFRSLATAHRDAIGVILSGGGTDGSVGFKAIKEEGGLLLVQDPDEAEYDSMPRAAISTGLADLVLPVRQLAQKLDEYSRQVLNIPQDAEELSTQDLEIINRILAYVNAHTGNDFSQYKRKTILRRIQRRMQITGNTTLADYLAYMHQSDVEAQAMFSDLLIGVTNFFRDREAWDALALEVIPTLFNEKKPSEIIRVWVIGCATGEEAYTMGILILEQASKLEVAPKIQIFASDLDENSLVRARQGLYPAAIEADVSPERLNRFFRFEGNHYRVRRDLRDIVLFTNHSILRDPPFSHIDLISCRNLLIYLQHEIQDKILDTFYYALNRGGFLFLGTSESADSKPKFFQPVNKPHRIFKAKPWLGGYPHLPHIELKSTLGSNRHALAPHGSLERSTGDIRLSATLHQEALEANSPPSVLVSEEGVVLHISESAGRYLRLAQGPVSNELFKLVRPELIYELRSVLFQAFDKDKIAVGRPILVKFNGEAFPVTVFVCPYTPSLIEPSPYEGRLALVMFLEDQINKPEPVQGQPLSTNQAETLIADSSQIKQLESENRDLRERLQVTTEEFNSSNEEMKAANEELQSINEEYRSTTEELETSKEELQSINEELQTVNQELKVKLDEISHANSDLENLIAATDIATLFLDRELRIRRYIPGIQGIFNIITADRGRPIEHLTHKLDYDRLVEDSKLVLRTLIPIEREISGDDDRWFMARIRPYRSIEDSIEGIVVTFIEITRLKMAEKAQIELNETLERRGNERTQALDELNQKLSKTRDLFYTLFHANPIPTALSRLEDGELLDVNEAYVRYFDKRRDEILGRSDQGLSQWLNQEEFTERIALLDGVGSIQNFELEVKLLSGEPASLLISLQRAEIDEQQVVISSFIDITMRVQAERRIRALAAELAVVEQKERMRTAQLLQDDLQQRISAVQVQLDLLSQAYEKEGQTALIDNFAELDQMLADSVSFIRNLSAEINPPILVGNDLVKAVNWLSSHMQERYGLDVKIQTTGELPDVDDNLQVLLFDVIRELLFNIVQHSGVLQADVSLEHSDHSLKICVADSGKGFDLSDVMSNTTNVYGLPSMSHRLSLLGCKMSILTKPDQGTQVVIDVPLDGSKE